MDLVGVASPSFFLGSAELVGRASLHVDLIGLAIDDHDEVGWPSAIEILDKLRPFPMQPTWLDPVLGDVAKSTGISDSLPRSPF